LLHDGQQIRPKDNYAAYSLGRLYENRGEYTSAIVHYEKALNITEAKARLAQLYFERFNRPEDAAKLWKEILVKKPDHRGALAGLAKIREVTPASDEGPTA